MNIMIFALEQWTGVIDLDQVSFLDVPDSMDIAKEERDWFASGGDSSGKSFAEYLESRGAKKIAMGFWMINYL